MKEIIELSQPLIVDEKEIKEIVLDFGEVTGKTLLSAETMARRQGDNTPQIMFSMRYQTIIAAKLTNIPQGTLSSLAGGDFQQVIMAVNRFLFQ